MNDQELLELVQHKQPDDLSIEEIEQLRAGIHRSTALREQLAEQLLMDQSLEASLGRSRVSVEKILAASTVGMLLTSTAAAPASTAANWIVGTLITTFLTSVLVVAVVAPSPQKPVEVVPPPVNKAPVERPPGPRTQDLPPDQLLPPLPADPAAESVEPPPADPKQVLEQQQQEIEAAAQAAWDLSAPKEPFAVTAFEDFAVFQGTDLGAGNNMEKPDEALKKILVNVPGQNGRVSQMQNQWVAMDGLLKFNVPWRTNAVLRLSLYQTERFQMHFWHGRSGVSLRYYPHHYQTWAAYGAARKDGGPQPDERWLWATDDDTYRRTRPGTMEVRHQAGRLILSRGDVELCSVPMPEPPTEIYFEGRTQFRGLRLLHGAPWPNTEAPSPPLAFRSTQPAELDWKKQLPPDTALNSLPDGSIELTADKNQKPAWVALPLPEAGLYEAVFLVEDATPGTGVFLGDARGEPVFRVGFFRETKISVVTLGYLQPNQTHLEAWNDPNNENSPWALAGPRTWLRLVLGVGTFKAFTSGDGRNWAPISVWEPQRGNYENGYAHIGLYTVQGAGAKRIKLRQVELRNLQALTNLAPPAVLAQAPALAVMPTPEAWLREATRCQPADVSPSAWLTACALRTLAAGPKKELGQSLVQSLVDTAIASPLPPAARFQALDEAALLTDAWDQVPARHVMSWYEKLGQQLFHEGHRRPLTLTAPAMMKAPIWTRTQLLCLPESLARAELTGLASNQRWDEMWQTTRRLKLWAQDSSPHSRAPSEYEWMMKLNDWAHAGAFQQWVEQKKWLSQRATESMSMPASWRHPLVEQLSKEGYNILAEFEAALSGSAYADACQIVATSSAHGALGLLPEAKDPQLMVSLPAAVALAMQDTPELQQAMQTQFGQRGKLRVRQAIAEANLLEIQAATVQFFGTEAAAEAHRWLGDRALSSGDFTHAIGHYQHLLPFAGTSLATDAAARLRLAGALTGRDVGEPATRSVQFGDTILTPTDFEQLVTDLRTNRSQERAGWTAGQPQHASQGPAPVPQEYTVKNWARFAGAAGQGGSGPAYQRNDWVARQLSTTISGSLLIVSNRFEVTAFDMTNGQTRWTRCVGGSQGRSQAWPLVPMRPVVAGDRVFTRLLTKDGPELFCLSLATGDVLWRNRAGELVASDPVVLADEVYALCLSRYDNRVLQVVFAAFDPRNGQVRFEQPLVQFRDAWDREIPCQIARSEDKIFAAIGGTVCCVNLLGQPRWLRRQTWVPATQDHYRFEQAPSSPILQDGLVYAAQPGVMAVECLDMETGRLKWRQATPSLVQVVGMAGDRLLLETLEGFQALSAKDGRILWTHEVDNLLAAELHDGPGGFLYAKREPLPNSVQQVSLVWLDLATGRPRASQRLSLTDKQPMFGPLVSHQQRLWAFHARGEKELTREILELVSTGPWPSLDTASATDLPPPPDVDWTSLADSPTQQVGHSLFPGWKLLDAFNDPQAGLRGEYRGQKQVLFAVGNSDHPVTWAKQISVAAEGKTTLSLLVGCEPNESWELEIRAGDQVLTQQSMGKDHTPDGWKHLTLDLSPHSGRTLLLTITQTCPSPNRTLSYWKTLSIAHVR